MLSIEHHESSQGAVLWRVDYEWNLDNTVASRTETDNVAGTEATVSFTYDNRRRLTGERRVVDNVTTYDLSYSYDPLGNRQTRYDSVSGLYVDYLYDTDYADPEELDWPTRNNRLLRYEVRAGGPQGTLLRTVWYT